MQQQLSFYPKIKQTALRTRTTRPGGLAKDLIYSIEALLKNLIKSKSLSEF